MEVFHDDLTQFPGVEITASGGARLPDVMDPARGDLESSDRWALEASEEAHTDFSLSEGHLA